MNAALEVVVLVGIPGSGKSTFYKSRFAETHALVSKDLWPNARHRDRRQARVIEETLGAGRSLVVDNTNPTREERAAIIEAARRHGARVTGYYFATPLADALVRNARREGRARVPDAGVYAIAKRMCRPRLDEGFDALFCVRLGEGGFAVEPWKGEGDEAG
jgi:predicted kinase